MQQLKYGLLILIIAVLALFQMGLENSAKFATGKDPEVPVSGFEKKGSFDITEADGKQIEISLPSSEKKGSFDITELDGKGSDE